MAGKVGTPVYVTRAAYAKHRDVSKAAVTQWAAAGRIVIAEDGRVDLHASDKRIEESGGSSRGGKRKRGTTGGVQDQTGPAVVAVAPAQTLLDARTAQASIRAKTEEVEYRELIGELVERVRWEKALADGLGPILAALESLSTRLGIRIAGETDVRKIESMIDDEVALIRRDAAATLRRLIAGPGVVSQ